MGNQQRRGRKAQKPARTRRPAPRPAVAARDPYAGDGPRIRAILDRFRQRDPRCQYNASHRHHYRLGPPLDEAALARYEAAFGVQLPADYRSFLKHIGDGGPGPGSGLHALSRVVGALEAGGTRALSGALPGMHLVTHSSLDIAGDGQAGDDANDDDYDDDPEPQNSEYIEIANAKRYEDLIAALFPPELADLIEERNEGSRFFPQTEGTMWRLCKAYESAGEALRSIDLMQFEYAEPEVWDMEFQSNPEREPIGDRLIRLANFELSTAYLAASGAARGTVWVFRRTLRPHRGYVQDRIAESFREFYEDYLSHFPWERNPDKTSPGILDRHADGEDVLSRARAAGNDPEVYLDLYIRHVNDDPEGLLGVLEHVISQSPPSSLLAHFHGNVLTRLGRHAEAVTALRKAVDMDEAHEDLFLDGWFDEEPGMDLADNLEILGQFDEALQQLVALPPSADKFARIGRIYLRQGRLDEAIEVCGLARFLGNLTDDDFAEADALNTRGDALRRQGRFDEARRDYERARYSSEPCHATKNLAALACNEGRPEDALIYLRRALCECYSETDYMTDPDFAPARALPGFAAVVACATWKVPR